MTPDDAIRSIEALEKFGMELGLERISAALQALGTPQESYRCVHVAGTNGKGSTANLIAAVLAAAGYRTGLFTSPPLEFFGERIRIDGQLLADAEVPGLLQAVLGTRAACPEARGMTQFEVITAMAFLHFARARADVAVVEVGLGGRLDSTNVMTPEVAAVTNVGLEHTEHLGSSVETIAREKAGILKPGVPVVTAARGRALDALLGEASRLDCPAHVLGRDFEIEGDPSGYRYRGRNWELADLEFGMLGGYQRYNLAVALAALETLAERGWRIGEGHLRRGIAAARWPGRLELLGQGPRLVLDGAHNPDASRELARVLEAELSYRRLWLVLGILGDKDSRSILGNLIACADFVILTRPCSARALDPTEIQELAQKLVAKPTEVVPSVASAVDRVLCQAEEEDLVCVTGSLTTVGEARSHLRSLGWLQ